ncbi:hypothetical protein [Actinoplanes sp. NPDC049316]|uniref:hypothetical protein n=1 Tax=Actinoplanes sp. NPDC049316 TaxID=3154727 RepID=UPI003425F113
MSGPADATGQAAPKPGAGKRRGDRVAAVGVVGALAGTLLGAVIAGIFGLAQTRTQVSGTRGENLRLQRQESYSALLTDYVRFQAAADDYVSAVLYSHATGSGDLAARYNGARLQVEQDLSTVEIVGSLPVTSDVRRLRTSLLMLDHQLVRVTVIAKVGPVPHADDDLRAALAEVKDDTTVNSLLRQAREDVGAVN